MNDHTIQYKLDNTINPSPLKKFNTRSNIGALGLKFRERVTFGPQRGAGGYNTDDQCYEFRVIEVIPSSF